MKKFLNVVIGILIFGGVFLLSLIMIVRLLTAPNTLNKIVESEKITENEKKEAFSRLFSDDEIQSDFYKYIDDKKFKEVVVDFIFQFYEATTANKKVDTSNIEKLIRESADKYNEDHEDKISDEILEESISNFTSDILEQKPDEVLSILFKIIYSNNYLYMYIIVLILLLGLLYLINKIINTPIFVLGVDMVIVAFILFDLFAGLNHKLILSNIMIIVLTDLIVGILLIILSKKINNGELVDDTNQNEQLE